MKTAEERIKLQISLARAVYAAHLAYEQTRAAAEAAGLDCRNPQHILAFNGRRYAQSVLIGGKLKGEPCQ